ncbi:N-acetyltransferase family protein [Kitasatospora sp. NPDC004240]
MTDVLARTTGPTAGGAAPGTAVRGRPAGPLHLRAAVPEDLPVLADLRAQAAEWVAREHGVPQWSTPFNAKRARRWIARGATVMALLEPDGAPVATASLLARGDRRRWTPEELAVPARYLAKIVVDRDCAGLGIGTLLTDWARRRAHRAGAQVVRIDAWSDNPALHARHRAHGWRWVRTVPGLRSGALFELPALADAFDPAVCEAGPIVLPGDRPAG